MLALLISPGYSAIVNYLDFTSVSIPVTMVDRSVDVRQFSESMANPEDAKTQTDCKRALHLHTSWVLILLQMILVHLTVTP